MPIEMKAAEKRSRLWEKLPLPPQKDPLAAPPENEIVGSVIEALKRAQRTNVSETCKILVRNQ